MRNKKIKGNIWKHEQTKLKHIKTHKTIKTWDTKIIINKTNECLTNKHFIVCYFNFNVFIVCTGMLYIYVFLCFLDFHFYYVSFICIFLFYILLRKMVLEVQLKVGVRARSSTNFRNPTPAAREGKSSSA